MNFEKLSNVGVRPERNPLSLKRVPDSTSSASTLRVARRRRLLDSARRRSLLRRRLLDSDMVTRPLRQREMRRRMVDSNRTISKISYARLRSKIKDALEETTSTDEAVDAVTEFFDVATPTEVVQATIEILGETVDKLEEANSAPAEEEFEEEEFEEIEDSKAKKARQLKIKKVRDALKRRSIRKHGKNC